MLKTRQPSEINEDVKIYHVHRQEDKILTLPTMFKATYKFNTIPIPKVFAEKWKAHPQIRIKVQNTPKQPRQPLQLQNLLQR